MKQTSAEGLPIWVFSQKHRNSNNSSISNRSFATWKQKMQQQKLPQWALNLWPLPFRSNAHLSQLLRHVLLGISLNWHSFFDFESFRAWLRDLRSPSNTCLNSSERRALDPKGWSPRFNAQWDLIWWWPVLWVLFPLEATFLLKHVKIA